MSEQESRETNNKPSQVDDEPGEGKPLGLAGNIAATFINSPVTPLLMMAFLGIGLLGLFFTPRQEDPKISVPMVDLFVQYPGATAEQVENLVTNPLERIMSEIPGVRHVYSATRRGAAMVTVRFLVGEDLGESIVKVHDKVQSNLDKIPPGVAMPLVRPVGIDDVPVVTVTLWSPQEDQRGLDDGTLRTLAMDVLQRLQQVPNTGRGFVVGGRSEQVRVEVFPERLNGYGITLDQVAQTIRTANAERAAGNVESNNTSFQVYTGGFLQTPADIARLVVAVRKGAPVYVRDVAHVVHSPEEAGRSVAYYTGPAHGKSEADKQALREGKSLSPSADAEPAVTIAIAKKIGSNGVTVAQAVKDKLDSLKGQIIPDNVQVSITRNYGETANQKVNELLTALFEAAVAVSILCLVFLGLRAATVVITVIPIVILITVWAAWVIDYTIDRVSLFALVFSIGILVDDATVVVENIFRRWLESGKTTVGIAIDAVREVGNPTILATLTIIAALLPMGVVSGLMGPYMRPIPVLGSAAMFFSLIAALMFAPWFAMRVRPQLAALEKAERREAWFAGIIGRFYRPCMIPICTNKLVGYLFLFILVGTTMFVCSLFYFKVVPVKMLPFDNKPEFNVVVNMPEGTALPVTANVTAQLARELRKLPEVTAMQTYAGTASPFNFNGMVRHYYLRNQPWEADIQVMLLDKNERERGSHDMAVEARALLTPLAKKLGAKIQIVEMPPGPPVLQTVVAEIYGPDAATRRQVAADMTAMFKKAEGVVDVDNYMSESYSYWRFEVDTEKAVRLGISVDAINRNLAMAMGGHRLGDVKRGVVLEPTYIVMQVPLALRSQVSRLGNLPIATTSGQIVPLAELGRFVETGEEPLIYHKDLRSIEYVTGEMEGFLGAPIYGMFNVEDLLDDYTTPDGAKITGMPMGLLGPPDDDSVSGFEWGGEWTVTYETFRDMGLAFMAALVLIYGLIVWEFKNFSLAGLIMAPIPLTLIGVIPGHLFAGAEFTATSMIGFIALAGIVVRNSILLVEFVKHEVAAGKDIQEAVLIAGQIRMRPILITALTLMAGAWALFTDPIFQGMAVSLFFGAAVATVLTLVVIPRGCISMAKHFYVGEDGVALAGSPGNGGSCAPPPSMPSMPLWMVIWSKIIGAVFAVSAGVTWLFYILRAMFIMARMGLSSLFERFFGGSQPPPASPSPAPTPSTPPPSTPSAAASPGPAVSTATPSEETTPAARSAPKPQAAPAPAKPVEPVEADEPEALASDSASTPSPVASATAKPKAVKKTPAKPAPRTKASKKTTKKAAGKSAGRGAQKASATPAAKKSGRKRRGIRLKQDIDE